MYLEAHAGVYSITSARWRRNEHITIVRRQRRTRFTNSIVNIQQLPINTLSPFVDRPTEWARTIFVDTGRPDDKQRIQARRTDQIVFNSLIFPKTNETRYTTIIHITKFVFERGDSKYTIRHYYIYIYAILDLVIYIKLFFIILIFWREI